MESAVTIGSVLSAQLQLEEDLEAAASQEDRERLMFEFVKRADAESGAKVADFGTDLEWVNVERPLSLHADLQGKVLVVDFFTFCCINCMHILPDLHALEEKFSEKDGLLVVGVHSAKFPHEKLTASVRAAVLRYAIGHPVACDGEASLWQDLSVSCWPTLLVLGPRANPLLALVGEGRAATLHSFVSAALRYYREKGELNAKSVGVKPYKDSLPPSLLLFPGKVCTTRALDADGEERLVVADTAHHTVLVTDSSGRVLHCVGDPEPGCVDGEFSEARFNSPQGVCVRGQHIFVADTNNHLVRLVDMTQKRVSTLVGTGSQGTDKEGGLPGLKQPISSPWDLVLGSIADGEPDSVLFIAMAGTHQIWAYFLSDGKLPRSSQEHKAGTCVRLAGSGNEENRNNSYPHKASFAQPSGLSFAPEAGGGCLYVADSESSAVRAVSLRDGAVKALVGGERDPMNLFAFGDVDAKGVDAKLQHPLGVAWHASRRLLYVADSYNHKIKAVDPSTRACVTLVGSGRSPDGGPSAAPLGRDALAEPGGLCVGDGGKVLYVADTNNHRVCVVDLDTCALSTLPIHFPEKVDKVESDSGPVRSLLSRSATTHAVAPPVEVAVGRVVSLVLSLSLPEGAALTAGAPSAWQLLGPKWLLGNQSTRGQLSRPLADTTVPLLVASRGGQDGADSTITLEAAVFYCAEASGTCLMGGVAFRVPLRVVADGPGRGDVAVRLEHRF
ncbi:unnamed protein product [Lampetra planeri]